MERYTVTIQTPLGRVPFIGATMTPEREREITRSAALRNMHKLGLSPHEENLSEYYRRVRKLLA